MGFDISAQKVKVSDSEKTEFIAYIRFAMWNSLGKYLFFGSLNAEKYNSIISGNQEIEYYSLEEIKKAKEKLNYIAEDYEIIENILEYSKKENNGIKKILVNFALEFPSLKEIDIKNMFNENLNDINEFYDNIIESREEVVEIFFG